MASGHVNRINRPNTWLHRPSLQREDSSCQLGAVHTWHKADMERCPTFVSFRGKKCGLFVATSRTRKALCFLPSFCGVVRSRTAAPSRSAKAGLELSSYL